MIKTNRSLGNFSEYALKSTPTASPKEATLPSHHPNIKLKNYL